jgi:thiosulfate/3-mercaptopyruvate sulfurtransferase
MKAFAGFLAVVFCGLPSLAQEKVESASSRAMLVSVEELARLLHDPDLRVVDVRPRAEYDRGHVPEAVWVDVAAVSKLAGQPVGLTDKAAWEAWIRPLGLDATSKVIVYDGKRQLDAARVWWILTYLGVRQAGLLDGGFAAWQRANKPTPRDAVTVEPKAFPVIFQKDRSATREEVLAEVAAGKTCLVDARSDKEYTGETKMSKRGGHIPGARRLEWSELVDSNGKFIPEEALKARIAPLSLLPGQAAITHCQGGGRASVNAFVLERLGIKARNYYLGWSDWGNEETTPVREGAEPDAPKPE